MFTTQKFFDKEFKEFRSKCTRLQRQLYRWIDCCQDSFDKKQGLVTFSNGFVDGGGENRDGYRDQAGP